MTTKTCTKCGVEKEITEFHKRRASHDGYSSWCKWCVKTTSAAYNAKPDVKRVRSDSAWSSGHAGNYYAKKYG